MEPLRTATATIYRPDILFLSTASNHGTAGKITTKSFKPLPS